MTGERLGYWLVAAYGDLGWEINTFACMGVE